MRSPFPNPSLRVVALGGLSAFVLWSHGYAASTTVKVPPSGPSLNEAHPAVSPIAIAGAGAWIFIKLPRLNYEPLAASPNGVVLLRNTDHPLQFLRWKAGETLALGPEATFERMTEINEPSAANGTHIFDSYAINPSGVIALAYTYSSVTAASSVWDQYIRVWDPADTVAKLAQGEIDRRIAWDGAAGPAVALGIARHSRLAAVNNRSDTLGNFVAGQFTHTPTHSGDPIPWISSHRILAQSRPVDDPVKGANVNSWFGADLALTGLNSSGQHIGHRSRTGINAAVIAGVVEFQNVDFSPAFIGETGMVLGRTGLGDFRAFAAGEGAEVMYSTATRTRVPLPTDGRVTWVDELDRPNGYAPDGSPAVWTPLKGPDGLPLSPVQYVREVYVPLPVPRDPLVPNPSDDWQINPAHYIPPNAVKSQLGIMRRGQTTQPFLAIRGGLVVDANRDGVIERSDSDLITASNPFRLWINDDDDSGDTKGDDIPGKTNGANYADDVVNGTRDLVDFFPVFLDLKELLTVLPPTAPGVAYKLKQADSALNFVYSNLTREHALDYHRQLAESGFGDALDKAPGVAKTHRITSAGVELGRDCPTFLAGIKENGWGVLLVEGSRATSAPLVLSVEKDGAVIAEAKLDLRISKVEDMFRHVDLTQTPKKYDGSTYTLPAPVKAARNGDPGEAWPDSQTNGKYFVFLHGFNVDGRHALGWHSEIFKRLHVLGSKARFVGVTWHGATGIKLGGSFTDYHGAVFNAFQTGDALAGALSFAGSADVTIAAHSLGNIVASQAIQSGGLAPNRYYMINCAAPIEAYDFPNVPDSQVNRMTESKWKRGSPGNRPTYAANWHQFFDVKPSDHRSELKWKSRFGGILLKTHNFHSPGDDVVEDPEWDSPSVLGLIFTQGFNLSRGAWVTQEFAKGANVGESLAVLNLSRVQGGWGESVFYAPSWGIGPLPTSSDQTREPYFGYFLERDLFDVDPIKASAKAGQKSVQYDLLARGIPALSFAVAVHPLKSLENPVNPSLNRNFDMEALGRDSGIWPTEGHTADGRSAGRWLHSDFKNVALPYVHKMYEEMINRGSLK
jgi:hypothetical protein